MQWFTLFRQSTECEFAMEAKAPALNATNTSSAMDDAMYYYDDAFLTPEEEVEDCEPSLDYPFCASMWFSIYKVYTMMLGEIDESIFRWNTLSLVLFCIFFLLVVILLLNILIAIITDLVSTHVIVLALQLIYTNQYSPTRLDPNSMELLPTNVQRLCFGQIGLHSSLIWI